MTGSDVKAANEDRGAERRNASRTITVRARRRVMGKMILRSEPPRLSGVHRYILVAEFASRVGWRFIARQILKDAGRRDAA